MLCVEYWPSLVGNIQSPWGGFIILLAAQNFLWCTTPVSCQCEVSISTLVHPRTHSQMFINFYSVRDPYVQMCCGSVDVSGADQGDMWLDLLVYWHSSMCVFQCQSPRCCVFIMCTWCCVHLLLRLAKKHLRRRWLFRPSLCTFVETASQQQWIIPPVPTCFLKGQILLCNKAKSCMENLLLFPVLFLILTAVGLKPL